jgi:hypothetical protein
MFGVIRTLPQSLVLPPTLLRKLRHRGGYLLRLKVHGDLLFVASQHAPLIKLTLLPTGGRELPHCATKGLAFDLLFVDYLNAM